ncbi:MAG: GNAT family N-acetyltransferase, partial [Candidatus Heimdallarchaeota archaeon]|nr:GNAT family N-acetyltransferase [Candidatus Heimdallarchaeota archaeon]
MRVSNQVWRLKEMDYKIIEFEPKEAPDDFWDNYIQFTEANFRYNNPGDPLPNREATIQRQKADIPDLHVKRWLVITPESKIIAWAGFGVEKESSSSYEENKHLASTNIAVLHDYQRKGIGTELLKVLVKETQSFGITVLETGTDTDSGRAFLKYYGAQLTIEGAENRLKLEEVDWELMQSWVDEGPKRAKDVKLESFTVCPEEFLEEYAEIYTEALNMQPLGESEHRANIDGKARRQVERRTKEIGRINYTLISREKDGRISGMTEIYYDPRETHVIHQELTCVRPEFRGRGLGKWLKGQMILYIRKTYPEAQQVNTGNAETNAPMLS